MMYESSYVGVVAGDDRVKYTWAGETFTLGSLIMQLSAGDATKQPDVFCTAMTFRFLLASILDYPSLQLK